MKQSLLKKLINMPINNVAMEVKDTSVILDAFREYSSISGKAVYIWKEDIGLYRSDLPHVKLPATQSYQQALDYIHKNNSGHLFVLMGFDKFIKKTTVINTLKNTHHDKDFVNKIMMVDTLLEIPAQLQKKVLETKKLFQLKQQFAV